MNTSPAPSTPRPLNRKKLVVIHGLGGTYLDGLRILRNLFNVEAKWDDGAYLVERDRGLLYRRLLQQPDPDRYMEAFQRLFISRLLKSCVEPGEVDPKRSIKVYESQLLRNFAHFGLPMSGAMRHKRALQMEEESMAVLRPVLAMFDELEDKFFGGERRVSEIRAREIIEERQKLLPTDCDLPGLMEAARGMQETGGDLDTVASATFYTQWLYGRAKAEARELLYGRDYEFVFVNYHQGFRHLAEKGPADVLMADFPTGAIPDLEGDVRYLLEHDVYIERFEDHHPFNRAQRETFEKLEKEGLIGFVYLSGDFQDDEDGYEAELKCGADMVYQTCLQGNPWETDGVRELRKAAHSEDFVTDRYDLGMLITGLIKGGICKVELAEILVASLENNDAMLRLRERGWESLRDEWEEHFREIEEQLLDHTYIMQLERPEGTSAETGGQSLGEGSDLPVSHTATAEHPDNDVRLIMALAMHSEPGRPKLDTGRAIHFFRERFPQADYIFYCYGASILVARRLNQADLSLDMSRLMPRIGGEGDGGHAGASVGRPEANPKYPTALLGKRVNRSNFRRFMHYMVYRLEGEGYQVKTVENHSKPVQSPQQKRGARALLFTVATALLIGLVLKLFHPAFQHDAILESNERFFPQLLTEETREAIEASKDREKEEARP